MAKEIFQTNDCVRLVNISNTRDGEIRETSKGMVIKTTEEILTVLFTNGMVCTYKNKENNLQHLDPPESLAVVQRIIKVLEKKKQLNQKIEEQKHKVNELLTDIL